MKTLSNTPAMNIYQDIFVFPQNSQILKNNTSKEAYSDNFPADFFKHDDISYTTNEFGFRSDHLGSGDFLFAGCSHTFGVGLPIETIWPKVLNDLLDGNGFSNVGMPGASIDLICYNVIRYLENFKKPKAVFILFPDFYRKLIVHNQKVLTEFTITKKTGINADDIEENIFKSFMAIKNLESYCDAISVPLLYSSWQRPAKDVMLSLKKQGFLKNVFDIEDLSMIDSDLIGKHNSRFPHYWDVARDNEHFGEFENLCFAHRFKWEYEQNKR